MDYLSRNQQYKDCRLQHIRTYYYSGEYTDNLIKKMEQAMKNQKEDKKVVLQQKIDKAKKSKGIQSDFFKIAKNYYFFEVRKKPLQFNYSQCNIIQKGVDVQIAVDLVEFAYKQMFDIVVLLSGDIDLLESVKTAKNLGKHVILFGDETVTSEEMKREADFFINMSRFSDEDLNKFSTIRTIKK